MKIQNIEWRDFALKHGKQLCAWVGTEGDGCKQYLVPVRFPLKDEKIEEDGWGIRPSRNKRPILQANAEPGSQGLIFKVSSYTGIGKSYGHIYVVDGGGQLTLLSFGICGNPEGNKWEEAIIIANNFDKQIRLLVTPTVAPDLLLYIDRDGIVVDNKLEETALASKAATIHVHDPKIKRWSANGKEIKNVSTGRMENRVSS